MTRTKYQQVWQTLSWEISNTTKILYTGEKKDLFKGKLNYTKVLHEHFSRCHLLHLFN